ncbi:hypothetical protein NUU61_005117 [Penicillium alfredii]|uniref:Structure-specific endonuclease subunit SLX4 n=1 Tax=Penicillium alfredii TaxID=1506179 RepID=A0A9W9K7V8_9EURO|nr:uncharacterized protein NUU61_005117 [Penicillium alfredii]KAJ5095761.1 hypothetical protein NUU61_005117 [Penicillium alfredii]
MAGADVIVLSSPPNSPPRSPKQAAYDPEQLLGISPRCATPPPIPSPSELFQPPSRSRFFPAPSDGRLGDATKPKRRPAKKAATSNDKTAPSRSRPKANQVAGEPESAALGVLQPESLDSRDNAAKKKTTNSQKGRPRASNKSKDQGNMTLAGKVTKKSSDTQGKQQSKNNQKATQNLSKPTEVSERPAAEESNALGKHEDLHLNEAMRRRIDWTPPSETAPGDAIAVDDDDQEKEKSDGASGFGKLLSDYNFSGTAPRELPQNPEGPGPTKRRRLELVNPQVQPVPNSKPLDSDKTSEESSSSSGAQAKKKTKGKTKRFTTLTARMTAQYTSNDVRDEDSVDTCVPDIGTTKPKRGKSKTEKEPQFVVLSPEAAVKSVNEQDLIFGTCSQLEREDSPETLRETQQAIRASESLLFEERGNSPNPSIEESAAHSLSSTRSVSRLVGTRNLWRVAARDTEGSLVQKEAVDIVDSAGRPGIPAKENLDTKQQPTRPKEDNWFEIDYEEVDSPGQKTTTTKQSSGSTTGTSSITESRASNTTEPAKTFYSNSADKASDQRADSIRPAMPQYSGFTDAELSKQIIAYGFKSVRGRKKMIGLLQKCWGSKHGSSVTEQPTMPQTEHPTEAAPGQPQSDKTLAQSSAQAPQAKSKAKAKAKSTTSTLPSTMDRTSDVTEKPKSIPRTSPKKSPQKSWTSRSTIQPSSFMDVEEIQDSEEELMPSPSQIQKRYTEMYSKPTDQVPAPPLDLFTKTPPPSPTKRKPAPSTSSSTTTGPATLDSNKPESSTRRSSLLDLPTQITKAVRAQPKLSPLSTSSSCRSRPTWHEKILMFDPIVLEDFTAWLNVEGLSLVGEDREISAVSVREWCESKGICCCWKKNVIW